MINCFRKPSSNKSSANPAGLPDTSVEIIIVFNCCDWQSILQILNGGFGLGQAIEKGAKEEKRQDYLDL